jgi:hypothetical protein
MTCPRCGLAILPGHFGCVNCARQAGRPPVRIPQGRVRSLAGWSNAAALGIAVFVLSIFVFAFQPLLGVWVASAVAASGGREPSLLDRLLVVLVAAVALAGFGLAAASFIGWLYRARRNVAAFADTAARIPASLAIFAWFIPAVNYLAPAFVVADVARASVAPEPRRRRRLRVLVWAWWISLVLAQVVLLVGNALGDSSELSALRAEMADGHTVDVTLARHLLGAQVVGRLPGALLYLTAGVLAIILMHTVNTAQYERIEAARALLAGQAGVPAGG